MLPVTHTLRHSPSFGAIQHTTRMPRPVVRPTVSLLPPASAPASAPTPTARLERAACLNCSAVLVGKFCHGCGQAAKTPARITIGAILHELPHAIFHLDHALPHTVFALLRRPGHTIRDYLEGKRVKMYSPFALVFLIAGVLGAALVAFKWNTLVGPVGARSGNEIANKVTAAIFKNQAWVRLAFLPGLAVGPLIVLRRRTGFGYGEHIVAWAMVTAGSAMVSLIGLPIGWLAHRISTQVGGVVGIILELSTTLYVLWAYAQLQDDGKRNDTILRWLRSFASLVVATAALVVGLLVVALVVGLGIALAYTVNQKLHVG